MKSCRTEVRQLFCSALVLVAVLAILLVVLVAVLAILLVVLVAVLALLAILIAVLVIHFVILRNTFFAVMPLG